DDLVDIHGVRDVAGYFELLVSGGVIPGVAEDQSRQFAAMFSRQSNAKQTVIKHGIVLAPFATQRELTTGTSDLLAIAHNEAEVFAAILQLSPEGRSRQEAQNVEEFNQWLLRFGKAGYFL